MTPPSLEGRTIRIPHDLHTALRDFARAQTPPWPIHYTVAELLKAGMRARRVPIIGEVGADDRRRSPSHTQET